MHVIHTSDVHRQREEATAGDGVPAQPRGRGGKVPVTLPLRFFAQRQDTAAAPERCADQCEGPRARRAGEKNK